MRTRLLIRCAAIACLSVAATIAMVIAPLAVNSAQAAAPAASVVASAQCHGSIGASSDPTDLPNNGNDSAVNFGMGFLTSKSAKGVSPAGKKGGPVNGLFALSTPTACSGNLSNGKSQNPCVWSGSFTGSFSPGAGVMTANFGDPPTTSNLPADTLLKGCSLTFFVQPYSKNSSAALITTSLVTGSCAANNTRLVMVCTLNNN